MKHLFSLIIIFISTFTYSQKCKYERNEVDEFTKNNILETKSQTFTVSGVMGLGFSSAFSLVKVNDQRYIKLHFSSPAIFSTSEGNELMLKLENDEVIKLYFLKSEVANPTYQEMLKSSVWSLKSSVHIPDDVYETLMKTKINKVRFYLSDGYHDDDVSAKRANKFIEALKCIE